MRYFTARAHDCRDLGGGYSWLTLEGCAALRASRPGQFVMLRGAWGRDPLLPRAYSVLAVDGDRAELLVRRVGRGSALLAHARAGDEVAVLGPLGSGFPDTAAGVTDLLVAGGCGVAPLYFAARRAADEGRRERALVLVGGRQSCDLPLCDDLRARGFAVRIATEDGSVGERGLVTALLAAELERRAPGSARIRSSRSGVLDARTRILACGPEGMLRAARALARQHAAPCYLALEAPMACGLGACLGCAVPARAQPYLYVCKDGPVFRAEDVWP
jgi:dihydroorotate dehydrogenase electron transfer subunit